MWVTQTYLGDVERDAKLFVYYCYENYNSEQHALTKAIQEHLEQLGEVYGDKVSLMVPNSRYAGRIEAEVREFSDLWFAIREYLPGLLLAPAPLIKLPDEHRRFLSIFPDRHGYGHGRRECQFVPLKNGNPKHLAEVIRFVRDIADDAIETPTLELETTRTLGQRFFDAVEVKPGIWGIRIDLKKLARR